MDKKLPVYITGGVVGSFILVYGSAVLLFWMTGNAFMGENLVDLKYVYLSIYIGMAIVVSCFVPSSSVQLQTFLIATLLFALVFLASISSLYGMVNRWMKVSYQESYMCCRLLHLLF